MILYTAVLNIVSDLPHLMVFLVTNTCSEHLDFNTYHPLSQKRAVVYTQTSKWSKQVQ